MLTNLRIRNFKAWEDTGDIRLAPITLFFGANSSGKSSIGQFLMMLKQTTESPNRKEVLNTGSNVNDAVKLGSFRDMVYSRDPDKHILFTYTWKSLSSNFTITDPVNRRTYPVDSFSFSADIGLDHQRKDDLTVYRFDYRVSDRLTEQLSVGYQKNDVPEPTYSVNTTAYSLERNPSGERPFQTPYQFYGFPDEVVASYQNISFVQDLVFEHRYQFEYLYYLGPLRVAPERTYTWNGSKTDSVGYSGELTVAALLGARQKKVGVPGKRPKTLAPDSVFHNPDDELFTIPEIISHELAEMGLVDDLSTQHIEQLDSVYKVEVRVPNTSKSVDLADVGFGVSQVLPVLVQCFCAPSNSIIILEQPEMHLHPRAQAALADVMIDVINSHEPWRSKNIQLIIETHSEHFLRRLQRRIAEDKLPKEMLAAYFAEMNNGEARLNELQIDEYGNIRNWPKDFFGDDDNNDIMEHSLAAINKRIALKANGHTTAKE